MPKLKGRTNAAFASPLIIMLYENVQRKEGKKYQNQEGYLEKKEEKEKIGGGVVGVDGLGT
jgi:hypothetical protein